MKTPVTAPLAALFLFAAPFAQPLSAGVAEDVLGKASVSGGLVVVLGADEPAFLDALAGAGPFLVHCLDADSARIARAREALLAREAYGPVAIDAIRVDRLPYADGLVNLVVVREGAPQLAPGQQTS